MGRATSGVTGMKFRGDDQLLSMTVIHDEMPEDDRYIFTITDGGFGKRSSAYEYRATGRGGQGIAGIELRPKRNGREVVATFPVRPGDDVMLVTDSGRLIRLPADQVRITGRQAMGVTLLRLNEGERVTSCFPVLDNDGDNGVGASVQPVQWTKQ